MRLNKTVLLLTVILLLSLSFVQAWGIDPARQRAQFTDDQQQLSVTIENPDRIVGYFKVEFKGSLAPYAHYTTKLAYLDENTASATIPFTLKLPSSLPPGMNKLTIEFQQLPDQQAGTVGSLITLVADVNVDVPLNGNHITAQLDIGESKPSTPTPITIGIVNKGEADVAVWADIVIKGPTNKELASWQTGKKVVAYQGVGKIETSWTDPKEPGLYEIEATVHYDDKLIVIRDTFIVGSKEVIPESIGSSRFSLGGIVPFEITVRSKWNELIKDVFADVYILNKQGGILQSFKTASQDVDALSRAVLSGYWDTEKLVVGSYDINVVVNYDGEQSQETFPVVVKMDELEVTPITGEVTAAEEGFGKNSLLIILIIVLIVTNVIIILYFRRMKKK